VGATEKWTAWLDVAVDGNERSRPHLAARDERLPDGVGCHDGRHTGGVLGAAGLPRHHCAGRGAHSYKIYPRPRVGLGEGGGEVDVR
jgi:hypothetical protein